MDESVKPRYELSADELALAGENADAVRSFRLITIVGQRLRYLLDQRLRDDGLTTQQGFLLGVVRARGSPSLGEVAEAMSTTHQNAKQIALAMERKGMVRFVSDPQDGRVRRLEASDEKSWPDRNAGDFEAIGEWFSGLSQENQESLAQLLARLAKGMP